jgi:beta-mannosidase
MESTTLRDGWRLKQLEPAASLDPVLLREAESGSGDWLPCAPMPAMVHDTLLAAGRIRAPWLPGAAQECLWVAEKDWAYAVRFAAAPGAGPASLVFDGLDTIVDIYLNGKRIASNSSMYQPVRVDVGGRLRAQNTLVLHFRTVFAPDKAPLKIVDADPRRLVRRPSVCYRAYLGPNPYFSRVGIFGAIRLEQAGQGRIAKVVVGARLAADLGSGAVAVQAAGVAPAAGARLRVGVSSPSGRQVAQAEQPLQAGAFSVDLSLAVDKPELWWPRGYGAQPLYTVEIALVAAGGGTHTLSRTVGFRRITMPAPLHFCVNEMPVRLWGGNWVAPRLDTAVWDSARVGRLLDMAEQAHFNVFRVWACTESPDDEFYAETDRRGFLVWQDFTDLPLAPDEISRAACREEAAALVERLKHHPSLLIWCGGNEEAQWHSSEFGGKGGPWPARVAAEDDVGGVCARLDPDRPYIPSSPYYGIDPNDPQVWDTHGYTNLWYIPGYDYLVFASEDTRITAPPLRSLKRFMAPGDIWPADHSPIWKHGSRYPWPETWSKYTSAISWLKTGPVELFYDATNAEELVYRLGMAESKYYQETIERQRRGRPGDDPSPRRRCGGYIVWKLNDSWPQVYSAKVDYFLEPYIPYYAIRRAYAPVLLSIDVADYVWIWLVNDTGAPVEGTVTVEVFNLDENRVTARVERRAAAGPDESVVVGRLDRMGIGTFRRETALCARLTDASGNVVARAVVLSDIERRLVFPDARLDVKVEDGALVVSTDKFARAVVLEGDAGGDEFGWGFEDSYFDLVPGETRVVRVLGSHARGLVTARAFHSPHKTVVEYRR